MSKPTGYIQAIQEAVISNIARVLAEDGVRATVRPYAGDAASEEGLADLQRESDRQPVVMVSFAGRQHARTGSSDRMRREMLSLAVIMAARHLRSPEDQERTVYRVIESVDRALLAELTLPDALSTVVSIASIEASAISTIVSDTNLCVMQQGVEVDLHRALALPD